MTDLLHLFVQMRDDQKVHWEFVCHGVFNPVPLQEDIDIRFAETVKGAHGYTYCHINVDRKRGTHIENAFAEYDQLVPDGAQIKLTNLPGEPSMIGFGRGNAYKKHSIYKEIKKLQQKGCPTYKTWNAGTSEPLGYDSAGELEESPRTSPKKRSADPKSTSYVQSKKHQSEHHKAELQADRKDRDERAEADRKDREERDKRVEASQKEIKQMLVKLLSND